jgi:serralysin
MASTPGTGSVSPSGDAKIDGLLTEYRWDGSELSYSDPDSERDYGSRYFSDFDGDGVSAQFEGFSSLSRAQLETVHAALNAGNAQGSSAGLAFSVTGFTRLHMTYAGSGDGDAAIRVANTRDYAAGAYAYFPANSEIGGDLWLGKAGERPAVGNYEYSTILHELGHALGLKHSHESDFFGSVPERYDTPEYTVMTYRSFIGGDPDAFRSTEIWGEPQSFMALDIAALQYIYGANFTTNAGDTVYSWRPDEGITRIDGTKALEPGANRIFATIWDGGGSDTYDLSAYSKGVSVDLRPGRASTFSGSQLADLGGGPDGDLAQGNIFNALLYKDDPRSLIEDVVGGSGDDRLRGNAANNRLKGGDGDDKLIGDEGADLLLGGDGSNVLIGGQGGDVFRFVAASDSSPGSVDWIVAGGDAPAFERPGSGSGDLIDLSRIDADETLAGDQAFILDGQNVAGHLRLGEHDNGHTIVRAFTSDAAGWQFKLIIEDGKVAASEYTADDFLL